MAHEDWSPPGVDVSALRREEAELERRLGVVRGILRAVGALRVEKGDENRTTGQVRAAASPPDSSRYAQVVQALREAGRPLSGAQIYRALRAKDSSISWKTPGAVLRSMTFDKKDAGGDFIVRAKPGIYALRGSIRSQWKPDSEKSSRPAIGEGKKLDALIEILDQADRPLTYDEIHTKMQGRYPGLTWKVPSETVRSMVARSNGAIVKVGVSTWTLANRISEQSEEVQEEGVKNLADL